MSRKKPNKKPHTNVNTSPSVSVSTEVVGDVAVVLRVHKYTYNGTEYLHGDEFSVPSRSLQSFVDFVNRKDGKPIV